MRKTILYLVIFGLLAFAVYYFLFNNNNDMPYSATEAGFTIKDTAAVGKIYIVSSDGESITLDRTDTGWVVNKQYKALRSTLNLLMETLQMQTALYPVTKNAYENVVKALSTDGIKVEVYDRKGLKISVFYVGGTAVNNTGTNMMMENARTPYVVQVQGFNGYLTPRYSTRLRDWRDRTVFNIPPEELKSISVQYEGKPLKSFVISRDNGKFEVSGDPRITKALDTLNTRKCNLYFKYFTNINCEGYLNGLEDMDKSIKTAPKQSSIDVAGIHGQHQHVDVYWMAINKRSKNRTESNEDVPDDYDADRLYAVTNYKDTILIQQNTFRKIFRQAADFFQKDDMTAVEPGVHTPGGKPVPKLP
jgi:hypothetical protein